MQAGADSERCHIEVVTMPVIGSQLWGFTQRCEFEQCAPQCFVQHSAVLSWRLHLHRFAQTSSDIPQTSFSEYPEEVRCRFARLGVDSFMAAMRHPRQLGDALAQRGCDRGLWADVC